MTMNPSTKIDRKALAKELAQEIGAEVKYLGVPSCAYRVGPYTINKDASIAGNDLEIIRDFLIRHDYIHQELAGQQYSETPADEQPADLETESASDDLITDSASTDSVDDLTETNVSIPISELTAVSLTNLLKLVYAKQKLISAMTQSEGIYIDVEVIDLLNDEKPDQVEMISELIESESKVDMVHGLQIKEGRLTFTFPYSGDEPARWASYAKLLLAFIDRAKKAQHINAKRIEPTESEMKYYCNSLLNQLGFGGADFKADRAALLGHLTGYAAFKSADKMEAHKIKFSERRKAAQLAANESTDEHEQTEPDLKADSVDSSGEVMA